MFPTFSKKRAQDIWSFGYTVKGLHDKGLGYGELMKSKSLSGVSKTRHKQMPMLCFNLFYHDTQQLTGWCPPGIMVSFLRDKSFNFDAPVLDHSTTLSVNHYFRSFLEKQLYSNFN